MNMHLALVKTDTGSSPLQPPTVAPQSAVSAATTLVGLVSLSIVLALIAAFPMGWLPASWLIVLGTALPMAVWELAVVKVHLRPSTGLDFSIRRPWPEVIGITLTKTFGLAATLLLMAVGYFFIKSYSEPQYAAYLSLYHALSPWLVGLAPLYIAFTTRRMVSPKDGLWHFGRLACLRFDEVDMAEVKEHLRSWLVKAFFIGAMVPAFSGAVQGFLADYAQFLSASTVQKICILVRLSFMADLAFGVLGYLFTFRLFDSHIRNANPFFVGWVAALACYGPFALFMKGGPLDYGQGMQEWLVWLAPWPPLQIFCGLIILVLTIIYVWATVSFGLRFSNLTHRGILTNGPYRWTKHPAYLSKNVMWWFMYMPFLATTTVEDAVRNSGLMLMVNALYYARARTEEMHLGLDPAYREYAAWMAEHGLVERLWRNICGVLKRRAAAVAGPEPVAEAPPPVMLHEPG